MVTLDKNTLRQEMAIRGINQTQLAKLAGIRIATMTQVMAEREVSETTLAKITHALYVKAPARPEVQRLVKTRPEVVAS